MTTTLPDPATGTRGGSAGADLHAEAERLAAMPRSWTPSISELLEEEARRHDASGARLLTSGSPGPSLADLDHVLDALAANDAHLAALHAERATLLAQAIHLAGALEHDLLDPDDHTARSAPSARRLELAHRAVTAVIATTLHLGEHATATLTDHARTLTTKAPATLSALGEGRLSWAHATAITKHLADLSTDEAAAVERSVLTVVLDTNDHDPDDTGTGTGTGTVTCTPAQVARTARRARETTHPVPADVRHAQAAAERAVWLDDGRDGMAGWSPTCPHPWPTPPTTASPARRATSPAPAVGSAPSPRRAPTPSPPSCWTTAPSIWQPPPAADLVSRPDSTARTTGATASRTTSQRSTRRRTRRQRRARRRTTASGPACTNSRSWPPSPARSARRSPSPSRS